MTDRAAHQVLAFNGSVFCATLLKRDVDPGAC